MPSHTDTTNSNDSQTAYAVIDGKRVPLDYKAARRLALNAHLLALSNPKRTEMIAEAERAERNTSSPAKPHAA